MLTYIVLTTLLVQPAVSGQDVKTFERRVMKTIEGKDVTLPFPEKKVTVFVFLLSDCPIANRYTPEFKRIAADYEKRDVAFVRVYVYKDAPLEELKQHTKEFGYKWPAVHDKEHSVSRAVGARVTPEAAVVTRDGKLHYLGRIDDWYIEHGRLRETDYRRDLRIAIDEVLADRPVTVPRAPAIGCLIEG